MVTAYLTEPGARLIRKGRTLRVRKDGQTLAKWELLHLKALVLAGPVQVTTQAAHALLRAGVDTVMLSGRGQTLAAFRPAAASGHPATGAVQAQPGRAGVPAPGRYLVRGKLEAMLDLLASYAGNYPGLPLGTPRQQIAELRDRVAATSSLASLRGVEGAAARAYWQAFPLLNRSALPCTGRSSRPPRAIRSTHC